MLWHVHTCTQAQKKHFEDVATERQNTELFRKGGENTKGKGELISRSQGQNQGENC